MLEAFKPSDAIDAFVRSFSMTSGTIRLELDCYANDGEAEESQNESIMFPATIIFESIRGLTVDGAENVSMFKDDGSVLEFDIEGNSAQLVIEWDDYAKKSHQVAIYKFGFLRHHVEVGEKLVRKWADL